MKNRSKILSPRATQIRRELSNSAEFAATGFSSIYSSAKSQLKKVISKISGVCSTALNLFFQNPEISYQSRELYSLNSKLDSISNTVKSQTSGPKPLYLDSYTMPPTPGRFLTSDEESSNKKEKSFKPEPMLDVIKRPEYGIPVWRQLGRESEAKAELNSDEKNKSKSMSMNMNTSMRLEGQARTGKGRGSAGQKKPRENPNSTPIRSMSDDVRHAGSDPGRETPAFCGGIIESGLSEDKEREKARQKNKFDDCGKIINQGNLDRLGGEESERDLDTFSFMDQNEVRDSELADDFADFNGLGSRASGRVGRNEDGSGVRVKVVQVFREGGGKSSDGVGKIRSEEGDWVKVGKGREKEMGFIGNDAEKKECDMVTGFVGTNWASKNSSTGEVLESGKDKNITIYAKKTESTDPEQITLNNNLKNPFVIESDSTLSESQDYPLISSSNPFLVKPRAFKSPVINLAKVSPIFNESSNKYVATLLESGDRLHSKSNSDGKLNPFSHSNPFAGRSSAPSSETKLQNPFITNPSAPYSIPFTSSQSTSNSSSSSKSKHIANSSILSASNESTHSSSSSRNPLTSSSQNSSSMNQKPSTSSLIPTIKQVKCIRNNENVEYPYNDELIPKPKLTRRLGNKAEPIKTDDKTKLVNLFVLHGSNENKKDGIEKREFNVGILPKKDNSSASRNFK